MKEFAAFIFSAFALVAQAQERPREIFLIAGQSNSANEGEVRLTPSDPRVFSLDPVTGFWRFAIDPQPAATGVGGSPWPEFGSILARELSTTVGLVSVGVSGSGAAEWLPEAARHYGRLRSAVRMLPHGAIRAVLWHQGEQDVQLSTSAEEYRQALVTIIEQLNADAGYPIPWFVAEATYVNFTVVTEYERARMAEIHQGQEILWKSGKALRGPTTDDLIGPTWRWDGIHLTKAGLRIHGRRWAAVVKTICRPVSD